jgi:Poxvirus A32 protein
MYNCIVHITIELQQQCFSWTSDALFFKKLRTTTMSKKPLQITKFSAKSIMNKINNSSSPVICVIGKRNTGKSQIVRALLYANREIPSGIVICPTENANSFYSQFCPDSFIYHEFDPDILNRIMKRQKRLIQKNGKDFKNNFFIVLDDCMYNSKEICNNIHIKEIFRNGRHFQITIIVAAQYVMDLPIPLRSNVDLVFCMRENNLSNVERLYKSFFGVFPTKQLFIQVFNKTTENYGAIVIDTLSHSNNVEDCVFWYKAPQPCPEFKIGSKEFWEFHEQHYSKT